MKEKKYLLGFYDYTVILTYIGVLMGFTGVVMVINTKFSNAIICLMVAGLCDMFDGTVASTKQRSKEEKTFGIQIDSLSDLICFGVLPAIFVYEIYQRSVSAFVIAGLYVLCALIRLSYFNVCEQERQNVESVSRKYFQGLPVTTVAVLLPAVYLIYIRVSENCTVLFPGLLVVMGALFISTIKIKKPQMVGKIAMCFVGVIEFILVLIKM